MPSQTRKSLRNHGHRRDGWSGRHAGECRVPGVPSKSQDRLSMGEDEVRRLLVIMGPDASGKVSKVEYMKFMEAEFERLDRTKTGELDVKDLAQSTITASRYLGNLRVAAASSRV